MLYIGMNNRNSVWEDRSSAKYKRDRILEAAAVLQLKLKSQIAKKLTRGVWLTDKAPAGACSLKTTRGGGILAGVGSNLKSMRSAELQRLLLDSTAGYCLIT